MCGFAAFFERDRLFSPHLLSQIDRDLFHRGPDSGGEYSTPGAAMVFRRLAIVCPDSSSDQPFLDQSARYVMTFNGEIYNYKKLRQELQSQSVYLRTTSDTEVIIEGYALWGESVFDRLEGMFSVVIYDTLQKNVIIARDGLGIKPLYISRSGSLLAVSSEMRPLRRLLDKTEVDPVALTELLYFRYAAGRLSNLRHIEMFPAGTIARFSISDASYSERCFKNVLDTFQEDHSITYDNALELIESSLLASAQEHMQSDVGYSIQLSGGVDSSLMLAMTTTLEEEPLNSYAIQLEDAKHDEGPFRKDVIARYKPKHKEVLLTEYDFADALPKAVFYMEGPSPHMGCVMLMLLCQEIKKSHKVVLTGEGSDELFGGYKRYSDWKTLRKHERIGKIIPEFMWPFLTRYASLKKYKTFDAAACAAAFINSRSIQKLFPDLPPYGGAREAASDQFKHFVDRLFAVDQTAYLESLLLRQDKMAMAMSIEARVPFAHYPLFAAVNKIPHKIKIQTGATKPLLKKIAKKWLPEHIVDRKKIGLTLPYSEWLRNPNSLGRYLDLLTENNSRLSQFSEPEKIKALVHKFRKGEKTEDESVLPHLINVELWLRSLDQLDTPTLYS